MRPAILFALALFAAQTSPAPNRQSAAHRPLSQRAAGQAVMPEVPAQDLDVINAALARAKEENARVASEIGIRNPTLMLIDQTSPGCEDAPFCVELDDKTFQSLPELPRDAADAFVARNQVRHRISRPPGTGIVVMSRDQLLQGPRGDAGPTEAVVSLPHYLDADSAVIFVEFHCGAQCGEGHYVLLRRRPQGWAVAESAMLWIS